MKPNRKLLLFSIIFFSFGFICQGAIPTGYYYYARGKSKAELKTKLSEISSPLFLLSYGSGVGYTWEGFYQTDRNADNTVIDRYSDISRSFSTTSAYSSISDMAIEHSFPKSWWGGYENFAYKDLFHLYPADSYTNGKKGNLPLGEVTSNPAYDNGVSRIGQNGFGDFYFGNCFEPAEEYKGDFARSYFYVTTIHENLSNLWNSPMLTNTTYPAWRPWAVDLLMKWHTQDPVSEKETLRNDAIYAIQGNRNPFIDHPELAYYIWGKDTLHVFDYPEERGAFLISPRRRFQLDFGPIFQNATKTMSFNLQGVNISSMVSITLANNNPFIQVSLTNIPGNQILDGQMIEVKINPLIAGQFSDVLRIQGGGLTEVMEIPVKFASTSDFIATEPTDITPIGGTLNWLKDPHATDYKVSVYQGETKAGDLIISGYYEGASNDKALELYNGTGATIDLSKYSLKKQTNGAGNFVVSQNLSGYLLNNQTYVIVNSACKNDDLRAKASVFSDSVAAFNGNDAIALFRDGLQIDAVGEVNGGADYIWGENKILKRKSEITHPGNHFNLADWNEFPYSDLQRIGNHSMDIPGIIQYIFKDRSAGNTNQMEISGLIPDKKYTYQVTSVRREGEVRSENTQKIKTASLEAPTGLLATETSSGSFSVEWEKSPYTNSYYADVFHSQGETTTETEMFNTVNTSGGSLPDGWTGTVSGNYTTPTSSGQNPPSVAFKNNQEWLKTKSFPDFVSQLSFMYRFPSSGAGSYFIVEAENEFGRDKIDSIFYVNTSKYYPSYNFSLNKLYTSVRFTYYKSSGNFALDDVTVTHGVVDTVYLIKNQFVESNSYWVENLEENKRYFFRVRSGVDVAVSPYSEVVEMSTWNTSTNDKYSRTYKTISLDEGIRILNLKGNENIRIYTASGILLRNVSVSSESAFIPLNEKGVFIIQVSDGTGTTAYKMVK